MSTEIQSVGRSAALAGLLWAVSVGGEIVLSPQGPDGSVDGLLLFGLCVGAGVLGAVFLVRAFLGLRAMVRGTEPASGAMRTGAWCCVAGTVLLAAFSLVALLSGLLTGAVWEPVFVAFALGMLLLLVGQATLGLGLRRTKLGAGGVWTLLVLAAAWIVVAVAVPVDPWHDIGMFGLFATWAALGLRLSTQSPSDGLSSPARGVEPVGEAAQLSSRAPA